MGRCPLSNRTHALDECMRKNKMFKNKRIWKISENILLEFALKIVGK
jgi:hypothetical protein